jgi:hypothetical protein
MGCCAAAQPSTVRVPLIFQITLPDLAPWQMQVHRRVAEASQGRSLRLSG